MGFLDIENVTKSYGSTEVLHRVDVSVAEGEFLVLVGPSGCGKSTLLNMIAGLEDITSGTIAIKGQPMNGVHPSKRNIAMVFQSYALYPNMTVAQNITFGLEMHGVPKAERAAAMDKVADMLQITPLLNRKPGQLSGGQRQRVAMGRALVRNPDVFLFDEPLSNLDAKLRVDMRTEIKKLHQRLGTTIVYVTHDQIEAMTLSTRIAVMNGGYVQQLGTPKEIYDNPANVFVASFMGSPSMNLIPAILRRKGAAAMVEITDATGAPVLLPVAVDQGADGAAVLLGIRPEAVTDPDGADKKARNVVLARNRIDVTEPAGSDTFITTCFAGKDVVGRMRADAEAHPGEMAELALNMDKAVLFDPKTENRLR
ncbi:sugar ABC transporter ATP-binding protein [Roseobacter denitrificans]|uniref:Sugar ABC transporter, ATP-binding protein, putative n=1 Tax=Roseobacter denitrificans (strain ATCC 33942 / OCh 114) TaxID=375451 RepID=Q16CR9_ROSDO|nr:sn-glycerol-3-phosphate ABC transporter ATP-binding protein UgpC [Roseobacter denitrificans]ABG30224.1 sugar ABC transporter, ATP-binding protein, putative [Roseobacter denitrificans OCh 114]AVL53409.1 sugar ABC transporter ATP-binding protein [Roseobacter denitrificans]SFF70763.1 carbohydrate ABC transporter ATP-binding protein, CUT1 family [Roseobacter denitrificans OCh 114]